MDNKLWFKAKRYGWGWTPVTWEGWLVTFVYVALIIFAAKGRFLAGSKFDGFDVVVGTVIPVLLATAIMIFICYKTGEKPRWRWGEDSKDDVTN